MDEPKISVVMPSYNQAAYIQEAIESVLSQDYPNKELLVIDGGSTDGAVDIIQRYESQLAHWESERDRGQSHALNKGFARASGHLLTWLNSDDILLPGALKAVARQWMRGPRARFRWLIGRCLWIDASGRVVSCGVGLGWRPMLVRRGAISVYGPSSFFSRELLDAAGLVDEDLHYMMDTELWLRFAKAGACYEQLGRYIWGLRLHPEAKMSGHNFADSPMASPDHPVWTKRRAEQQRIEERYQTPMAQPAMFRLLDKITKVVTLAAPRAAFDTFRHRGHPWQTVLRSARNVR